MPPRSSRDRLPRRPQRVSSLRRPLDAPLRFFGFLASTNPLQRFRRSPRPRPRRLRGRQDRDSASEIGASTASGWSRSGSAPGAPAGRSSANRQAPRSGNGCRGENRHAAAVGSPRPRTRSPGPPLCKLGLRLDVDPPAGQAGREPRVLALLADRQRELVVGDDDGRLLFSSSTSTSRTRAGESALATKRAGSSL